MQKKKIILLTTSILIILSIILLIQNTNKPMPQNITEQAKANYTTEIGTQTYDITNAVLEPEGITPTISAGMIPVKWNGENFVITTRQDKQWYDYAKGQPAYIMLNDGYYKSELEVGIKEDQLMENNVGTNITRPEDLGTICMWIPSFAYNNQDEILYIKQAHSVAGTYTMPEIFTYETEKRDFSLAGIWVECKPLANTSEVNTKINKMNGKNNTYGFLANTIATNANNEPTYKATIETYNQYIANVVGATSVRNTQENLPNVALTTEEYPSNIGNNASTVPQITNISNPNRTILKITNSNQPEPIRGRAYYDETQEKIKIEVTYNTNEIAKILDKKGNILSENSTIADSGDEIIGNKVYKYMIIDSLGNIKEITTKVTGLDVYIIENEDDLKFFRDAVNAGKTKSTTRAYQIADVKMNEGKYTIDKETGEITFAEDAEKWESIGKKSYYYSGTYDGQEHNISGMYIDTNESNQGLFGQTQNCNIKNLKVIDSKIKASGSIGGIVGYESGTINISNCDSKTQINIDGGNSSNVGGIVGNVYQNANINNCNNNGQINSSTSSTIGGIVGRINKGGCNIINCTNNATINSTSTVAGIVGVIGGSGVSGNTINIENCKNNGDIKGNNVAGIVNSCYYVSNGRIYIKKSYNTGHIEGNGTTSGIIYSVSSQSSTYYNRLCIEECFNVGNIGNRETTGNRTGIIYKVTGTDNSSYIRYCYNTGNIIAKNGECSGIAGDNSCVLQYCYNAGNIKNSSAEAVGIVNNAKNDISYCYNLGNIVGGSAGGIVRRLRRKRFGSNRGNTEN